MYNIEYELYILRKNIELGFDAKPSLLAIYTLLHNVYIIKLNN